MKVRVITSFNDKTEGFINRPINEVFECSHERAMELIFLGYAERVEDEQPQGKLTKLKAVKKHLCN